MFKNLPFALITSSIFSNNFNKVFAIFSCSFVGTCEAGEKGVTIC